jgi:hypothetical protein
MSLLKDSYNNSINLNVDSDDSNYSCNNKHKYSPPRMSDGIGDFVVAARKRYE